MTQQETIDYLQKGHLELKNILSQLSAEQMESDIIDEYWTVKAILSHLAAWNWETRREVDRVLRNQASWPNRYEDEDGQNNFNLQSVAERQDDELPQIINEWESSYSALIKKISMLAGNQWEYQSDSHQWKNGEPVTVSSLFDYEYQGTDHDGGHAKEIKRHFHL